MPDHNRCIARQVKVEIGEIGMAVAPADKVRGRVAAGEGGARNIQCSGLICASGDQHCIVGRFELSNADIAADCDVATKSKARYRGDFVKDLRD